MGGLSRKYVGADIGRVCVLAVASSSMACAAIGGAMLDHHSRGQVAKVRGEIRTVSVAGAAISYVEAGKRDGPPIVFLHGMSANKTDFLEVAARFSATHRIVVPDIPPNGDSVPSPDARFDLASQVAVVRQFLDVVRVGPATFVGSSMGGAIALALAYSDPTRIKGLVVLSPPSVRTPERSPFDDALARGEVPFDAPTRAAQRTFTETYVFAKPLDVPGLAMNVMLDRRAARSHWDVSVFQDFAPTRFDPWAHLDEIRAPTLVLWCDADKAAHVAGARVLAGAIPQAELTIFHGCGHLPHLERPAEVAARLAEFIAARSPWL